jgi:hypothetical protein
MSGWPLKDHGLFIFMEDPAESYRQQQNWPEALPVTTISQKESRKDEKGLFKAKVSKKSFHALLPWMRT